MKLFRPRQIWFSCRVSKSLYFIPPPSPNWTWQRRLPAGQTNRRNGCEKVLSLDWHLKKRESFQEWLYNSDAERKDWDPHKWRQFFLSFASIMRIYSSLTSRGRCNLSVTSRTMYKLCFKGSGLNNGVENRHWAAIFDHHSTQQVLRTIIKPCFRPKFFCSCMTTTITGFKKKSNKCVSNVWGGRWIVRYKENSLCAMLANKIAMTIWLRHRQDAKQKKNASFPFTANVFF